MQYRPEIDGLRALAVLSVILFHVDSGLVSGGYVGVDIFFVISGFLITTLIYQDLEAGSFSFKTFWIRRARRILPASLVMMLVTLLVFALYYPEVYFRELGESLAAQVVFSSNIYFWKTSGYFSSSAETQPLLHMWSLAVEEQFYFIFPALLFLIHRYMRRGLVALMLFGCLVSFGLSVYFTYFSPIPSFYLLPSRAWELGAGAMLAVLPLSRVRLGGPARNAIGLAGLLLVLGSIVYFDESTPFPSWRAALPVLGTVMIIWSGLAGKTIVCQLLSHRLLVAIGVVSYSLYLWHWPTIVFFKWAVVDEVGFWSAFQILVTTFVLAIVSYRFVEAPVRYNRHLFDARRIGLLASSVSVFVLGVGTIAAAAGNKAIVDPHGEIHRFYLQAREPEPRRHECIDLLRNGSEHVSCNSLYRDKGGQTDLFVWGDSHASALMPAFDELARRLALNLEFTTTAGCQAVLGMQRADFYQQCEETSGAAMDRILSSRSPLVVLVSSFVHNVTTGRLRDASQPPVVDPKASIGEFKERFEQTVKRLKEAGRTVIVFTEPPRLDIDPVARVVQQRTLRIEEDETVLPRSNHERRIARVYGIIDAAGIDQRLDYTAFFCTSDGCRSQLDGRSLYKDSSHISNYGAALLSPLIEEDLRHVLPASGSSTAHDSDSRR